MKSTVVPLAFVFSLLLGACASAVSARPAASPLPPSTTLPAPTESFIGPTARPKSLEGLARVDQQGVVTVEVTPTNLNSPSDTLDFDVALNTHSVDLGMDLAALSTLTTDTGITVAATAWDGPPGGGHHVSGKLTFRATKDGKSILEGATRLTLTILNVDAPSRTFEWQLK